VISAMENSDPGVTGDVRGDRACAGRTRHRIHGT
jgi:hypothetical protein